MHLFLLADIFTFLLGLGVIWLVALGIASVFWLWMLIDALVNPALDGTTKIVWALVVLCGHFIGALIYFFVGRGGVRPAGPTI